MKLFVTFLTFSLLFVISPFSANAKFIIEERENPILHDFSEMKIKNLGKELIEDIENDLDAWSREFSIYGDFEKILQHRNKIKQKIAMLKKIMQ